MSSGCAPMAMATRLIISDFFSYGSVEIDLSL